MLRLCSPAIATVTLIIGSVVYLKPTEVPRVPFTRDLVFLLLALVLILISASIGEISVREVSVLTAFFRVLFLVDGQVYYCCSCRVFFLHRVLLRLWLRLVWVVSEEGGALCGIVLTPSKRSRNRYRMA